MKNSVLRLLSENRDQWPWLILCFLLALAAGILKTQSAAAWGRAIDFGIEQNIPMVYHSLFILVIFVLADAFRTFLLYYILGHTVNAIFLKVRERAYNILTYGDVYTIQDRFKSGDMTVRINSDADKLSRNIAGNYPDFVRRLCMAFASIVMGFTYSWELALVYIIIVISSVFIINKISNPITAQRKRRADATGAASSFVADALTGLHTIKSYCLEERMDHQYNKINEEVFHQTLQEAKVNARMAIVRQISSVVQLMALFLCGALLVRAQRCTPGDIIAFSVMSSYIRDAFNQIDYMLSVTRSSFALGDRLYELLDIPMESQGESIQCESTHDPVIVIENLTFSYGETQALAGISLEVRKGQKVGVIGPSGCGKSTLVKLICGFYTPTSGSIYAFGKPIDSMELRAMRQNIAMITQDTSLFYGSVGENVQYGNIHASSDRVLSAISDASLDLWKMQNGLNTQVGEGGSQLSGGQRQRVSLARALVKNAPLLILDEATSALDTQTEAEIQATLDGILQGVSSIIVTHRVSAIKTADFIYCMENGKIIEQGTPGELEQAHGYYYQMCQRQKLIV